MTEQEIKDTIDADFAALLPTLQTKQADYLAANGRYFQGLCCCSSIPADGNTMVPDNLDSRPSYQAESWSDLSIDMGPCRYALSIHQYDGPLGKGWLALLQVIISSVTHICVQDFGPESHSSVWRVQGGL